MLDLIVRIVRHPLDYIRALETHTLVLKKQIAEGNDIYSFIFESTKPLHWKAGQHGVFRIPDKNVSGKKWRAFSVASAPSEKEIRITTIINNSPSSFKAVLESLVFGNTVVMSGPFGEFNVKNSKPIIGIASGVGITPFRSILKEISSGNLPSTSIHLLYAAREGAHIFKSEFDALLPHSQITIEYFDSQDAAIDTLRLLAKSKGNEFDYYISGSPRFIDGIRGLLQKLGVRKIINDPFKGY